MHGLLLAAVLLGAPVPKEVAKPPGVSHGVWTLLWNGHPYAATLSGNGEFSEFLGDGPLWQGTWSWDAEARILSVRESTTGEWFLEWSAKLDREMKGATGGGTRVELKRK